MRNEISNLGDAVTNDLLDEIQSQGQGDEKLECVELGIEGEIFDGLKLPGTLASNGEDLATAEVGAPEPAEDGEETNAKAALNWLEFGFAVIPTEPGTDLAAVDTRTWCAGLSPEAVAAHWAKHPTHDVGAVVGDSLVVARFEGAEAQAALFQTERAFDVWPSMMFKTPQGMDHLFLLPSGTKVSPGAIRQDEDSDEITLLTGSAIVLLPPSGGRKLDLDQASDASDLTAVDQSFIDAIQTSHGQPNSAVATPSSAEAISAPTGGSKDGEDGEAGVLGGTTFTAFRGPNPGRIDGPAGDIAQATAAPTFGQNGPDEGGEVGGVLQGLGPQTAAAAFAGLQEAVPSTASPVDAEPNMRQVGDGQDDVLTPKAAVNPVIAALQARGLYKTPLGSGLHSITCPWAKEHAVGTEDGSVYFEPDENYTTGSFRCDTPTHGQYTMRDVLEFLGVPNADARHKPVIRIVPGDLHRVVDASEQELANHGNYFQSGGLIVSVSTDPVTGDPSITPTSAQALSRALSIAATYEKHDGRSECWVACDPPTRHAGILYSAMNFRHLPPLAGVARQPYFREADGVLVTQPGYDKVSQRFGVFDPSEFVVPAPTREAALAALAMLDELLTEFPFAQDHDRSAALSAILTATVRSTLPHAPAFHARAPVIASGKSHLCELISAFAGPAPSAKVSFPTTSEEATKAMLSLLVKSPAVIEFDDMATDWIPHGVINRVLTAEHITDRILGVSKTATVSTRALFLGSGNNVGPVRDLLRRVITIDLDPHCATPATITYKGTPVETVRSNRGAYVAAVLTVMLAWNKAGSPRAAVSSIATYGGTWADYCRHPLIWLGLTDPATSLLEQVRSDPDGDALGSLLLEWHKVFGSTPTTVRKLISVAGYKNDNLADAIGAFPVAERGDINPSKLGWLLKKNVNRIVSGLKFVAASADGRNAWAVVSVNSPASPPLPASVGHGSKTVAPAPTAGEPDIDTSDLY